LNGVHIAKLTDFLSSDEKVPRIVHPLEEEHEQSRNGVCENHAVAHLVVLPHPPSLPPLFLPREHSFSSKPSQGRASQPATRPLDMGAEMLAKFQSKSNGVKGIFVGV